MERLIHIVPTIEHKKDAIEYVEECLAYGSEVNGSGGLDGYLNDYEGWLRKLEDDRNRIPSEEKVPALTYFLVRESDNRIVGMINIRLCLNERLRNLGGHIGYSIRPTERRKGYNKINLYLGLKVLNEYGVEEALLDCDYDNLGSSSTMKALGGKLKRRYYEPDIYKTYIEDYIIDVKDSVERYKDLYDYNRKEL